MKKLFAAVIATLSVMFGALVVALVVTTVAEGNELTDHDKMLNAMDEAGISYLWRGNTIAVFQNTDPADVCKMASAYPSAGVDIVRSLEQSVTCTQVEPPAK